jgi:predicted deacylase
MALALDIMKGGVSGGMAKAIQGQVAPSVVAAGTAQGSATSLTASVNIITSGTGGVILPACEVNDEVEVCNLTDATVVVYPDSGSRVNSLPANSGFSLARNTAVKVKKFSSTRWMGFLSA